jgi:hypothetical protein
MNVLVIIDRREAIPVRAIRYALWRNPPLPAILPGPGFVARSLRDMGDRDRPTTTTVSAKIRKDGNIIDVLPGFWFTCVQRIEKAPNRKNDSHLPAGVFLWREDFETAVLNKAFARLIAIPGLDHRSGQSHAGPA